VKVSKCPPKRRGTPTPYRGIFPPNEPTKSSDLKRVCVNSLPQTWHFPRFPNPLFLFLKPPLKLMDKVVVPNLSLYVSLSAASLLLSKCLVMFPDGRRTQDSDLSFDGRISVPSPELSDGSSIISFNLNWNPASSWVVPPTAPPARRTRLVLPRWKLERPFHDRSR